MEKIHPIITDRFFVDQEISSAEKGIPDESIQGTYKGTKK